MLREASLEWIVADLVVATADGEVVEVKADLNDRWHGELVTSDGRIAAIDCDGQIPVASDGSFQANVIQFDAPMP